MSSTKRTTSFTTISEVWGRVNSPIVIREKGIYFVRINTNKGVQTEKIVMETVGGFLILMRQMMLASQMLMVILNGLNRMKFLELHFQIPVLHLHKIQETFIIGSTLLEK